MTTTTEPPLLAASDRQRVRSAVIWSIAIGTLLRLAISAISFGSDDAVIWRAIAHSVSESGLMETYRVSWLLNHPPLPLLWSWVAMVLGKDTWFSFVFKLPPIAADAAGCALLAKIWLDRHDAHTAKLAAWAMALNPVAVLISGYHGNTDSIYAFLSLLAMYLLGARGRFFLGGLVLGAAVNVKLIPVLLVPVAFSLCRTRRQFLLMLGALALAALPFVVLVPDVNVIRQNMLSYIWRPDRWGVPMFLLEMKREQPFAQWAAAALQSYTIIGRWAIVLLVLALSVTSWRLRRWNAYELGTLTFAIFLGLAPGFGVQYTVMIVPLMLAVSISRAWVYGTLVGVFLTLQYWLSLQGFTLPLRSYFPNVPFPMPGPLFGLLAWWVMLELAARTLFRRRGSS